MLVPGELVICIAQFSVFGTPVSQGSKVVMKGRVFEDASRRKRLKAWRSSIVYEATKTTGGPANTDPFLGPVILSMTFTFKRPASHLKKNGELRRGKPVEKVSKPDLDKLIRAVQDAMTDANVWKDDSQVIGYKDCRKQYGSTDGVVVSVYTEKEYAQAQ